MAFETLDRSSIARLTNAGPVASATDNDNDTVIVTNDRTANRKVMSV
jgi:hypothetical protein